jgi:hypothetical protein
MPACLGHAKTPTLSKALFSATFFFALRECVLATMSASSAAPVRDPRPFVTAYQAASKQWVWIALQGFPNMASTSKGGKGTQFVELEQWMHAAYPGRSWKAYRVLYTQEAARDWIMRHAHQVEGQSQLLDMMQGPDLVAVVDEQTNKTVLTLWQVLHLGSALEIQSSSRASLLEPDALLKKNDDLLSHLRAELLDSLGPAPAVQSEAKVEQHGEVPGGPTVVAAAPAAWNVVAGPVKLLWHV